ncbi:aromatic acid/H+ symport family MFS transporter [Pantoea sp. S18]|uniref:MFS transporter n=1 Tax=Pantoea sp. S18 TaxID=3019892 RepID=UPI001326916B|nr:aromatic acid/H+ symport family MFS transporter [Pantoea sp. S18]MEA5103639.1 aromatic acid/H+ symport family MFS transporter [Pantoea sp. S18]MRS20565.1 MFS transporter [Enterobacteriaceae bacterium RIT692]
MTSVEAVDVRQLINKSALSSWQKRLIALCFVVVALDGMDIALMGFIAPTLKASWGVTNHQLGLVISAALIGLALGAMVAGPLADRYGRRVMILISVLFFGLWTLATAMAQNIEQMMLFRFLTGLGLGAAMPNVGTLVAEYAPERRRSFIITVVFCGFTFGAATGGFAASWLLPRYDWHSVMLMGGVLPLLVLPFLVRGLPESVRFLISRRAPAAHIHAILERMLPGTVQPGSHYQSTELPTARKGSVATVVSRRYLFGSLMLWGGYFMGLFLVYLIGSWMPSLISTLGMSVTEAAIVTAMYQAGGTIGSLFAGWLMDRINANLALAVIYFCGGIAIVALGFSPAQVGLMSAIAFCSGFCFNGANTGMNALSANYYPTHARATGSSWMHGVGRIGAIISAFVGAELLTLGWTFSQIFLLLAIPAVLTTIMLVLKCRFGDQSNLTE